MKTYAFPPQAVTPDPGQEPPKPKTLGSADPFHAWVDRDGDLVWRDNGPTVLVLRKKGGHIFALSAGADCLTLPPDTEYMGEVVGVLLRK